ncbi:MAG: cobalt ECF transporter T component CbiQ [Lachnospiraceae bacterium]|nr:cobalt ECF transporter T component CbiQ [Candidatus Equihabitans merdae]
MNDISQSIFELNHLDTLAEQNQWMNRRHPLVKLLLTLFYIILVVSFHKYDLMGLLAMMAYPLIVFNLSELSFRKSIYRLRYILPLVCIIGLVNPLFDKEMVLVMGLVLRGGIISMITLILKGIFTVLAVYLLIATTTIEKICGALRLLHMPKIMVTQIMLTYRYIFLLLREVERLTTSYQLRAPGQKGIHFKVWGSMVGMLLLRSIDRSEGVYNSMLLRGYDGNFNYVNRKMAMVQTDWIYLIFWLIILILLRIFPVIQLLSGFFLHLFG